MARNDVIELAGISAFLFGNMLLFYGAWQIEPLTVWFIVAFYLIVGGIAAAIVANRGSA